MKSANELREIADDTIISGVIDKMEQRANNGKYNVYVDVSDRIKYELKRMLEDRGYEFSTEGVWTVIKW